MVIENDCIHGEAADGPAPAKTEVLWQLSNPYQGHLSCAAHYQSRTSRATSCETIIFFFTEGYHSDESRRHADERLSLVTVSGAGVRCVAAKSDMCYKSSIQRISGRKRWCKNF